MHSIRKLREASLPHRKIIAAGAAAPVQADGAEQGGQIMSKHPFRVAIEAGASEETFRKLFAPNVVIQAPMLTKPVKGVRDVVNIVGRAAKLASPIRYTLEVRDAKQTILFWSGNTAGYTLEAATILVDGDDGLIHEVRVLMRPWPVVTLFRDAMYKALSATVPQDYWELQPKPADSGKPRRFTPIALKPIELALDMVLHSPMLAKSVHGKAEVEAAVGLAHEIQSPSSYTSIIATPDLLVELFDCDADGYPMEGLWVQKLNEQGQIYGLTVYLRPYPAVTVLRNMTKDLGEKRGVLVGQDYWQLPKSA
jgi:hypothetical protein